MFPLSFRVEGPPKLEAVRRRKGGLELLHRIDATAMQVASDCSAIDFVPPVGLLRLCIRMRRLPARVTFEPGAVTVRGAWSDRVWVGTLDRLGVHSVLVWEG